MQFKRVVIDVNDIMKILGVSDKTARKLYRAARRHFRKEGKHKYLTIREFCRYTAIPESDLHPSFQNRIVKNKSNPPSNRNRPNGP